MELLLLRLQEWSVPFSFSHKSGIKKTGPMVHRHIPTCKPERREYYRSAYVSSNVWPMGTRAHGYFLWLSTRPQKVNCANEAASGTRTCLISIVCFVWLSAHGYCTDIYQCLRLCIVRHSMKTSYSGSMGLEAS
eukprot:jgi/Botrbrau1/14790/Bobra.105_1s0005.1